MTRHRWVLFLVTILFQLSRWSVRCYPSGAPDSSCGDMTPQHRSQPQSNSSNIYRLQVSANEVQAGNKLTVSLVKSQSGDPSFKGFLIRAAVVGANSNAAVGRVNSIDSSSTRYLACFGTQQSGVTHTSNTPKSQISFEWIAPEIDGDIVFLATAVQDYSTYWVGFRSQPIKVYGASTLTPTLYSGSGTKQFSDSNLLHTTQNPTIDFDYTVCGETQSCFGFPINCIYDHSCVMIMSYSAVDVDKLRVSLVAYTPGYVAFGLSNDIDMGDDSVIECMQPGHANASVNHGENNFIAKLDKSYFTLESASYSGGTLRCNVTRPIITTVTPVNTNYGAITTDLNAENYYLMMAMGDLQPDGLDIAPHSLNSMVVSNVAVDMMSSEYIIVGGNNKPAVEVVIHGSLMVVAWIGTVSIAIFMARYYKDMWPETMCCNVKIWFAFHRTLNMITVLLTIAAFILIFVYKKGFSSIWKDNPHPILGCITTGLAIIQPFGALFRCAPGTPKRPIFNWFHFMIGNSTCIVAVVTIFFAVNLNTAHLPKYFWWILIAYIGFYVIVFLVMECLGWIHHRKEEHDIIPMRDYNGHDGSLSSSMHHQEKHGAAKFKHVMLFLFIFGVVGFTAALVAVICT